jgi:hypothetical protein
MRTNQFDIVFPADADTLGPTCHEAGAFALVAKANALATRASESRGEYRLFLEEEIRGLLYNATAHPPSAYKGGCAPYIVKGGDPWRKPWVI